MTGLGVGQAATAGATVRLPAAVSLAFLPYGAEAERSAARARDAGHEVFLQLPMEPFDYPDSDPGPQTLLTALKGLENADRLAWSLARFPGYVGVANFMGAKMMADPAFEPVLREIGARGLGFLDDGTGPKPAPANKGRTPLARAELVLDAVPRADAIDAALAQAEARARASGFALVSASGAALSVDGSPAGQRISTPAASASCRRASPARRAGEAGQRRQLTARFPGRRRCRATCA